MNAKDAIRYTIDMGHNVLTAYLSDVTDEELTVRPVPEANHIAWQLGHLVGSENKMITDAGFSMPALPDGFVESHSPEASKSDDRSKFLSKDEYLSLLNDQRQATLAALDKASGADLGKSTPESMQQYAPKVGSAFAMIGIHTMMHAAQFVPIRRKLGKPVLF